MVGPSKQELESYEWGQWRRVERDLDRVREDLNRFWKSVWTALAAVFFYFSIVTVILSLQVSGLQAKARSAGSAASALRDSTAEEHGLEARATKSTRATEEVDSEEGSGRNSESCATRDAEGSGRNSESCATQKGSVR